MKYIYELKNEEWINNCWVNGSSKYCSSLKGAKHYLKNVLEVNKATNIEKSVIYHNEVEATIYNTLDVDTKATMKLKVIIRKHQVYV